jgi:hypothetical protein
MWRPLWFLSLCAALAATPAHARWSVEARPLDTRPYTRDIKPLFTLHAKSGLSHLEGLGVELAQGSTVLFDVALSKDERPRQLELSLGYLTPEKSSGEGPSCAVSLLVEAGAPRKVDVTVPLRSIEPASIPLEQLRAHYDYLTPQVAVPLPAGATRLKVTARVDGACTAGRLVMLDPKGLAPRVRREAPAAHLPALGLHLRRVVRPGPPLHALRAGLLLPARSAHQPRRHLGGDEHARHHQRLQQGGV